MIGIIARSESTELVGALRKLLPDIGPAALRERLRSGASLLEVDPFDVLDEDDAIAMRGCLLGVVETLKTHGASFEIHQFGTVHARPNPQTQIEEQTLRNILDRFVEGFE